MIASDPSRADSMSAPDCGGDWLMGMIWLFVGTLYIIGWLYRRPLALARLPADHNVAIAALIFAGSLSQWLTNALAAINYTSPKSVKSAQSACAEAQSRKWLRHRDMVHCARRRPLSLGQRYCFICANSQ